MARKPLSKRTRFEIFKRDGFRCLYCGATPMQKALHVDHVVAVAEGGDNSPPNLVTSCADCNLGKSCVPLESKSLAVPIATQADLDHAEQIKEYLAIQRQVNDARKQSAGFLVEHWEEMIGPMSQAMADRALVLVSEVPMDRIIRAIAITARKMGEPAAEFDPGKAVSQTKYFHGVLRRWRQENDQ